LKSGAAAGVDRALPETTSRNCAADFRFAGPP
jgi:hypothetical protein